MNNQVLEQLKQEREQTKKRLQDLNAIINTCDEESRKVQEWIDQLTEWRPLKYVGDEKCSNCGKPCTYGLAYDINGDTYCPTCYSQTHHCGQDATRYAESPVIAGDSLKDLIDARVIAVDRTRCDKCPLGIKCPDANCVKVELIGGYYLCLTKKGDEK